MSITVVEKSKTQDEFPQCPMRVKYDGEKSKIARSLDGWGDIHVHTKKRKQTEELEAVYVLYMTQKKSEEFEVSYDKEQHRWVRNKKTLEEGEYSFVINKQWQMLAYSNNDEGLYREAAKTQGIGLEIVLKHSSLTRGEPVFFGGMGKWEKGTLIWNAQSGHYRPGKVYEAACKSWQKNQGVEDSQYQEIPSSKKRKSPSSDSFTTTS